MFKVNLKTELDSTRKEAISTAQADLLVDDEWTSTWFASHGMETVLGKKQTLKQRRQFLQEAYTEEQVRALCIKYRLRCLPVNVFRGEIDPEVPAKKRSFETDFTEVMEEQADKRNYRIVAPSELFIVAHGNLDPLLFYKVTYQGLTYYKLVHQWGGELNGWRSLVNYPLRSVKHLGICAFLIWLPIILGVSFNLAGLSVHSMYILSAFLLAGALMSTLSLFTNRHGQYQTSDRIWDSQPVF